LESYISLPYISHTEDIEILAYWKAQSVSFPILSRMAKDILAIPVTSVASETSFSLGGRVLSKLRASLLPKNVEIFVTTSNWMYGFEPEEKNEEYLNVLKEIAISEQINN
jgi:hAT family protein